MAHPSQSGGVARPCAARIAALVGWGPRAAPASPPEPVLNLPALTLSLSTRRAARRRRNGRRSRSNVAGAENRGEESYGHVQGARHALTISCTTCCWTTTSINEPLDRQHIHHERRRARSDVEGREDRGEEPDGHVQGAQPTTKP